MYIPNCLFYKIINFIAHSNFQKLNKYLSTMIIIKKLISSQLLQFKQIVYYVSHY